MVISPAVLTRRQWFAALSGLLVMRTVTPSRPLRWMRLKRVTPEQLQLLRLQRFIDMTAKQGLIDPSKLR
jgi:hypothetical protein